MPSTSRAAAALLVVSGILLFAVSPSGAAPDPLTTDPAVGVAGAGYWLANQIGADGLVESELVPGTPDLGATAQTALGLAVSRTGRDQAVLAADALSTRVDEYVDDPNAPGTDLPGNLATVILLAAALGQDPRAFGGEDLVARLVSTMQTAGPDAGLFGSQYAAYDGPFRQGLALAALSLVDPLPPELDGPGGVAASLPVTWLLGQQCANGSWMYRGDTSVPCALDAANFLGPDTNATALALIGLHAHGISPAIDAAAWLQSVQLGDGGWTMLPDLAGSTSDPDSTGLVLAGLRAAGANPSAAGISRLLGFQFGCAADASEQGSFFYPPWNPGDPETPNLRATYDAVVGLAPGVWPASLTSGSWAAAPATTPCPPPPTSTTTSTTSTPSTTSTTSTTPTSTTTAVPVTTTSVGVVSVESASASSFSSTASSDTDVAPTALARTGSTSDPVAMLALSMIAAGAALIALKRRARR